MVPLTFWAGPFLVMGGGALCTAGWLLFTFTRLPGSVLRGPLEDSVFSREQDVVFKTHPPKHPVDAQRKAEWICCRV